MRKDLRPPRARAPGRVGRRRAWQVTRRTPRARARGVRRVAGLGGAAAAGARPRDGVLGVDRDRRGGRRTRVIAPGTSSRATRCSSRSGLLAAAVAFQVPMRAWQQAAPWLFIAGAVLLVLVLIPGIGRGERHAPLDLARGRQPPALRAHEALRRAVRRDYTVRKAAFMHAEQPCADDQARLPADVRRDAADRRPAAARAGLRRVRGDHRDRHRHPVPRRPQLAALRGPARCCCRSRSPRILVAAPYRMQRISASWIRGPTRSARATSSRTR